MIGPDHLGEVRLVEIYDQFIYFCPPWANTENLIEIHQDLVKICEF